MIDIPQAIIEAAGIIATYQLWARRPWHKSTLRVTIEDIINFEVAHLYVTFDGIQDDPNDSQCDVLFFRRDRHANSSKAVLQENIDDALRNTQNLANRKKIADWLHSSPKPRYQIGILESAPISNAAKGIDIAN